MKTSIHTLLTIALWGPYCAAFGAPDTFIVDEAKSSLTISATIATALGSISLNEQSPGSLTAHFTGSLQAEVSNGSIRLLSASEIQALDSGSWRPGLDGTDESAPASFAGRGEINTFLGTLLGEAALRKVVLNVTSDALPVTEQGLFDASLLLFAFPATSQARFDYRVSGLLGTSGGEPLAGESANRIVAQASIETLAGDTVLTLPVDIEGFATIQDQDDVRYQLKGQLVAVKSASSPPDPKPFAVSTFAVTPTTGTFEIHTVPGKSYRILASEDLADWTTVIDAFIAAANSTKRDVVIPPLPNQYFRIEEN